MTGSVVRRPKPRHRCEPGWAYPDGIGKIPDVHDYPKGTVWRCAFCGRYWISTGRIAGNTVFADFRPLRWLGRKVRRLP